MKALNHLINEIKSSIPPEGRDSLEEDLKKYRNVDLSSLPDFNEDGSVAMYEIGGILLGRNALIRFIEKVGGHGV